MRRLLVMVASDLRQQVLDKSFFIFGLAVPLALMWVFSLIFTPRLFKGRAMDFLPPSYNIMANRCAGGGGWRRAARL